MARREAVFERTTTLVSAWHFIAPLRPQKIGNRAAVI